MPTATPVCSCISPRPVTYTLGRSAGRTECIGCRLPHDEGAGSRPVIGRNADEIRAGGWRVIRGTVPQAVRRELQQAVRHGQLGRLPKQGLAPEMFFDPAHIHAARRHQQALAAEAAGRVAGLLAPRDPVADLIERERDHARHEARRTTPAPS